MPTINGKVCVVNGVPVDKVFSNGKQVYGRNLFAGIDKTIHQAPGSFQWVTNVPTKFIKVGESLCCSVFINNAPHAEALANGNACCNMQAKDVSGNILLQSYGNAINFDADGISQTSMVVPNATTGILLFVVTFNMSQNAYYGYPKVEFGNVATPWTPAPEDVLENYIAAPKNLTATVIDVGTEKLDWE